jgi:hypothetical protein
MTDPRNLSPDQRELLDACEKVAQLPIPSTDLELEPVADRVLDLLEAPGLQIRGDDRLTIETLGRYYAGFLNDGHDLAAEGIQRLGARWCAEIELKAPLN